jgi:hypothetical protein
MPFCPELSFFYLYLKKQLEESHDLDVERADERFQCKPVIEKVRDYIGRADFLFADITHLNPNVFYELGLAHAKGKPVLLLTQDAPAAAPLDIRHYEFVQYDLARPAEVITALDRAVRAILDDTYASLYREGLRLIGEFNKNTKPHCTPVSLDVFQRRVRDFGDVGSVLTQRSKALRAQYLLAKVMPDDWVKDGRKIEKVNKWVDTLSLPCKPARRTGRAGRPRI